MDSMCILTRTAMCAKCGLLTESQEMLAMMEYRPAELGCKQRMKKLGCSLIVVIMVMVFQSQSRSLCSQVKAPHWRWHSVRYQKTRNYRSLKVLVRQLKIGMPRSKVECFLGEPDYSPVEGVYYYSSDKMNAKGITLGLVVEYRKTEYRRDQIRTKVTGKLESFTLMPIAE